MTKKVTDLVIHNWVLFPWCSSRLLCHIWLITKHSPLPKQPFDLTCSVTRFCEISPLWRNFINHWQIVEVLLSVWQNFEPTLAYFYKFLWYFFYVVNGQILKNNLSIWSLCLSPFAVKGQAKDVKLSNYTSWPDPLKIFSVNLMLCYFFSILIGCSNFSTNHNVLCNWVA